MIMINIKKLNQFKRYVEFTSQIYFSKRGYCVLKSDQWVAAQCIGLWEDNTHINNIKS